jgi:chitinase
MQIRLKELMLGVVFFVVLVPRYGFGQEKEIVGYFPSWKWESKNAVMTYDKIPYEKLTIIDYAFWRPLLDGSIGGINTAGDSIYLYGKNGESPLVTLAHRHHVKVMLSVGGWADSQIFPAVAANESLRTEFSHACLDAIRKFDFDGIDIDWEYPGFPEHNGTASDKHDYTLLIQTLRDSLNGYGQATGKKLLLSAALPASEDKLENFEIRDVAPLLDMLNVMTYDYNGTWSSLSGYNAPLYPDDGDSVNNIDATFKLYTSKLQIPSTKINIGIPFYGHSFAHCTALHAPFTGADTTLFPVDELDYNDIVHRFDKFRHWDDTAEVPYLIFPEDTTFVSYDDQKSVSLKADYVLQHQLKGVIIWEITGDYLEDGASPLLDTVYNTFMSQSPSH